MGGLLGFLIGKHLQDTHNADLNQQKNILDMYSNIATTPYSDPAINQQAIEEYFPLAGKNSKYFRKPEIQQKAIENLQRWKQMEQQAKGAQATAPPPTQSLASQGPPGASAPSGGNNYGQFAAPPAPPNALGQQIVAPVPAPPPDVPPPPPMGMDMAPAVSPPPTAMLPMVGPLRGELFKKKAEADINTASTIAEQKALQEAEFERMKGISAFNRQENEALMNRMKKEGGGGHIYSEIGVNGAPSLKLDPGTLSSRPVAGKDLLDSNPDMTDKYGKPIDPLKFYDRRQYTRAGGEELMPTSVPPIVRVETPDPTHPETRMIVARDRQGTVIYQEPYAPNAAFAPLVRSTTREQIIDLGNKKVSVPVTSTNTSQRVLPGQPVVAPPPAAGGGTPNVNAAPAGQPRTPAPTSTAPRGAGRSWEKGLTTAQILPLKNAIGVASNQLWGDVDNPTFKGLSSYASLADDQGARQRLGKALRMVLDAGGDAGAEHLGASAGPVSFSAGNLGTALSYNLGIPQAAADAKATALREVFEDMQKHNPAEVDYFNALMAAIPTITGFRKLTSGGAFRWSQQGLERELPMIGLSGVNNSANFSSKMARIADEPLTAIRNIEKTNPGTFDPRMIANIQGGGRGVAPPGPPAAGAPAVGTVMKGYKFKGGNPADQSSWEKVP